MSHLYIIWYVRLIVNNVLDVSEDCEYGSLNASLAAGRIVMCFSKSEQQDIFSASESVKEAGGVGLIYAQFHEDGLASCEIPCVKVDYQVGTQILFYIRKSRSFLSLS